MGFTLVRFDLEFVVFVCVLRCVAFPFLVAVGLGVSLVTVVCFNDF